MNDAKVKNLIQGVCGCKVQQAAHGIEELGRLRQSSVGA